MFGASGMSEPAPGGADTDKDAVVDAVWEASSGWDAERVGRTRVEVQQNASELGALGGGGATVADLLQNLKALGLKPHQLVNVFTNLKKHGFLQADLEVR